MKKLALIIAVAGVFGLSSCAKETVCKKEVVGVETKITIKDGKAESCVGTTCTDVSMGSLSEADYIKSLENIGYTCG